MSKPLFGEGAYDATQERAAVSFVEQLEAFRDLQEQGKVRRMEHCTTRVHRASQGTTLLLPNCEEQNKKTGATL